MSANTEGLLNKLPTVATCLGREARIHSDDLMTSSLSLIFKNVEKRTPTGIHDGFRQVMIFQHVYDLKIAVRMSLGDTVGIKERAGEPDILGHFIFLPL